MKRTPLLNTKLVQHMDVPTIPNVLMLDAGESLEDQVFVRGDLLDAESIDIYFKNTKYKLLNVFDVVTAKLRNHISDTVCHTNPIEKRYWNNKVDASRYEAAMSIVQERLHALEEIIKGVPEGVDFSSFITYDKLIDILSDRDTWPLDIDGYVKEGEKLGTINGVDFYQGDSITIGSTGPGASISYTADITSSTANSYKIGTLNVGTNSHFDLYGKDTWGGDGSPSPYTLPVASSNALGGIKIGYTNNSEGPKTYAVQLNGDNLAYVYVPNSSNPDGGEDGGYWELMFKATESEDVPATPDVNPQGWSHSAQNSDGSLIVWMTSRWVNGNGTTGNWQTPWRISGSNGENGIDGTYYEYIYKTTTTQSAPDLSTSAVQDDDFVPSGWNDNAQGVDSVNKYEWMAYRRKTFNGNNEGTWSQFYGPVLWSSYGRNGTDGDGVEYIFYLDTTGTKIFSNNDWDNPKSWFDDSASSDYQTEREYIAPNSGWTDDPQDMTIRGSKTYVSVRKRYEDTDSHGNTRVFWHSYSQPALWSYYALDGNTDIQDLQDRVDTAIDGFRDQIDSLHDHIEEQVQTDVNTALSEYDWLLSVVDENGRFKQQGWIDALNSYVSTNALIRENSTQWTNVTQSVNEIQQAVTGITEEQNGQLVVTGSKLEQKLLDNNSGSYSSMRTFYTDLNSDKEILHWLASGFESQSTQGESFANMYAATNNAIAACTTSVNTLTNTVNAGLAAKLDKNFAGAYAESTLETALSTIFAENGDVRASISAAVKNDTSVISLIAKYVDIQGYLSAGNATFKGDVNATTFRAGSADSANMVVNGDSIDFYFGNERRAYFTQGDNNSGMQLYILKDDDSWYKLDFENLSSASGNWGVSVYKRLLKSNNTMEEHRLYYNPTDNCYYTGPSTNSSKANGNYFIETPGWYSDSTGEGECLYGVVSDSDGITVVGAYVKDAQQYTLVNFENGVKHETSNFVYTGYAPRSLSIKGSGNNPYAPRDIWYSDTATILVPNGQSVGVNWISNGYESEPYEVDRTINTPVKNGTYDQLNGLYPEYETQDISRYAGAPGMIIEDDDLYY